MELLASTELSFELVVASVNKLTSPTLIQVKWDYQGTTGETDFENAAGMVYPFF